MVGIGAYVCEESWGDGVRPLPDPSGGTFTAAGDFDRLIPTSTGGLLDDVDPYGQTVFNRLQLDKVAAEIEQLLQLEDLKPIERRGLLRLLALVRHADSEPHLYLWFVGD